jgi:MarR family transcriptional regulator for hemolysin
VLARLMRNNFDRVLAEMNITRSQWGLIAVVARRPGATQRTIAEVLEMSEASAGRLIDRLCADGLLERRERDDDRRARAVYITDAAEPLLAQASEIGSEIGRQVFRGLEHDDLETLARLLGLVYENVARTAPWRNA